MPKGDALALQSGATAFAPLIASVAWETDPKTSKKPDEGSGRCPLVLWATKIWPAGPDEANCWGFGPEHCKTFTQPMEA
ncbi:hypothetical protein Pla52o_51040 [Novipirellula galeiformis]|uniref:Uncharacterized protein n=1 Tax=Novipirellula galeiformis TaxID=2528004 RepID=A0A5C6C091_9BACT|nr:hypothetical protein Pla52o_51040 [Novipirellula galeiformis]